MSDPSSSESSRRWPITRVCRASSILVEWVFVVASVVYVVVGLYAMVR